MSNPRRTCLEPDGIKQVRRGFDMRRYPLAARPYADYRAHLRDHVRADGWPLPNLHYRLPLGWEGHVPRRHDEVLSEEAAGLRG